MSLRYNPADAAAKLWPAGTYDAELKGVEEKVSKNGNDMEIWSIEVFSEEGQSQIISEYVVIPSGTFKIKQLAVALGQKAAFEAGTFQAENNIGAGFKVTLKVEQQPGYDDKNKIQNYKPSGATTDTTAPARSPAPSQRPPAPSGEPPYGDEKVHQESDIPFAWPGRSGQPI